MQVKKGQNTGVQIPHDEARPESFYIRVTRVQDKQRQGKSKGETIRGKRVGELMRGRAGDDGYGARIKEKFTKIVVKCATVSA